MKQLRLFYLQVPYNRGLEDFYYRGTMVINNNRLVLYHGTKQNTLCGLTLEALLKPQIELDLKWN